MTKNSWARPLFTRTAIALVAAAAAFLSMSAINVPAASAAPCLSAPCDLGDPVVANPIAGGTTTACAILKDTSLRCWGGNSDGQAVPPAGKDFLSVALGGYHGCAIKKDKSVVCWGDNHFLQSTVGGTTCSPDPDTSTTTNICPESATPTIPRAIAAVDVSAGKFHTCVVLVNREIACWGLNVDMNGKPAGQASPPVDCGATIRLCARSRARAAGLPPIETGYTRVSAGGYHTCALSSQSTIRCWGANWAGQADAPFTTGFKAVSAGRTHTCALNGSGAITCWGENGDGRATPPSGTGYKAISAGYANTCAIKSNDSITCWGDPAKGMDKVPSGSFTRIAVAGNTGCAQRADTTIICWGDTSQGQGTVPAGVNPTGPTMSMALLKGLGKGKWQVQISAKAGSSAIVKVQLSTSSGKPAESASKSSAKAWATRVNVSGSRPRWIRIGDSGGRWTTWAPIQPQIQV